MPATRSLASRLVPWAVLLAVLAVSLGPFMPYIVGRLSNVSLHAPNWALWAGVPLVVHMHVYGALTALVIGTIILLRPKGRGLHKALGWFWVIAMAIAALSSLFITGANGDHWSVIHLLSGWTIIGLPMAVWAIRNRKVKAHRRAMTGMFVGGLIVAGALTFIPGRLMFETFFG
jgi:uncharacterized membrane protein